MTINDARKQFDEAKKLTDSELMKMCQLSELLSDIVIDIVLKEKNVDNYYGNKPN